MKKHNFTNLIIAVMFWAVALTTVSYMVYYEKYVIYDKKIIPYELTVSDKLIFKTSSKVLNFGGISQGGISTKTMNIYHNYTKPLFVEIKLKGESADWIKAGENNFMLDGNTEKTLTMQANIPPNAEFGTYSGTMEIIFKRK